MKFSQPIPLAMGFLLQHAYAENFTQPLLWQDLADIDLIRVNDTYYYSASTMHFSPGAPILKSYDLVNWEYLSHSVPTLDFGVAAFNLDGGSAYNQGIYASSIRYHEASSIFYWIGCIQYIGKTYIYTAAAIEGPWEQASVISDHCFYDAGLLIDQDDIFYVAYSQWVPNGLDAQIKVAQLTSDLQVQQSQVVFNTTEEIGYIEGARFYKIDDTYYIWLTNPGVGRGQIVIKSTNGPFGNYSDWHRVTANSGTPVPGAGSPFQGALIDTPQGDWWYMAFVDRWPGGRFPVLAPITWDDDGWPNVVFTEENTWGSTYPYPLPHQDLGTVVKTDLFSGDTLGPQYEWNHDPDTTKWAVGDGLTLATATVTDDFFMARNTLTHRILGPASATTIELDISRMADGDHAGLVVFRYNAGSISILKSQDTTQVQMIDNIIMSPTDGWHTTSKGDVIESVQLASNSNNGSSTVWFRVWCDISSSPAYSNFSYSTDGTTFIEMGQTHTTLDGEVYFVGSRYGIFNYATEALGGSVTVKSFTIST
ncbi:hypothetical protein PFICI_07833 [Pestalotiopsis fici W106-1]|uniref:Beta-xylosidase C-terminal Concanavalin A-like domain-containing protein n=1 Tax=Pestalotiopsis fici (strain W106-1 / CGMCC3.15140) TaxID=1229662 RepID=W3X2S2_PESFW|nr:uncharacterized protein PFICI_07833 [Pestalotiopsis fici W106-1]ETS80304.1 hypothetical protein PFICI_07833 [Pestalotiopsis fici W106-1]